MKSFKVTNEAELNDLLQKYEQEGYVWSGGEKPTQWSALTMLVLYAGFPVWILLDDKKITWSKFSIGSTSSPIWQIGQSIPKAALEQLLEIPENPDGSITISKELQAQLVMEGRLK